jgi:catechol 2,3-dioxygenase-like lactoylglutathione lyase family enzyme
MFPHVNRRRFLQTATTTVTAVGLGEQAALPAALGSSDSGKPGLASSSKGRKETSPRILRLELLTSAPLAKMKAFYHQSLGLRVLDEQPDRLTIGAGGTRLTFVKAAPEDGNPFYHFAFNIPQNKILAAYTWQKERTPLLPIPAGLRDPRYPDDVVDYSHWNAHSLFFLDPGGNVVEYIARHDLNNRAQGPFRSADILYASEIGLIVEDVHATALKLKEVVGLDAYRGGSDPFAALGDERGLLLVMKRGRILNFSPSDKEKAAQVFRTVVCVRGVKQTKYLFPEFPYEVSIEE